MLEHTFCHIPGVGLLTEQKLWAVGLHRWGDFDRFREQPLPLKKSGNRFLEMYLQQSSARLQQEDPHFFARLLSPDQHWRLFREFRNAVAYVDIETTGMGGYGDHITTVALYDGKSISWYVHGENLPQFAADIQRYRVLVTYNGKRFDVPFIERDLGLHLDQVHIDLRFVLASLGYRGGLKGCERQLGIGRDELDGVDGFWAVLLWDEYARHGRRKALETLLAYNILDVVNLEALMICAYNRKVAKTPFAGELSLADADAPRNPFVADLATLEKVRMRVQQWGSI